METLRDLMIDQPRELYSAELQLKITVEKMAYQTSNENLRHSFEIASKNSESEIQKIGIIKTICLNWRAMKPRKT
jgi:ferritin-like metal-binding protein YciE